MQIFFLDSLSLRTFPGVYQSPSTPDPPVGKIRASIHVLFAIVVDGGSG